MILFIQYSWCFEWLTSAKAASVAKSDTTVSGDNCVIKLFLSYFGGKIFLLPIKIKIFICYSIFCDESWLNPCPKPFCLHRLKVFWNISIGLIMVNQEIDWWEQIRATASGKEALKRGLRAQKRMRLRVVSSGWCRFASEVLYCSF